MNIKVASATRAMKKAGATVTISAGQFRAVWPLSAVAEGFAQDDHLVSLRVRRATDADRLVEDYHAGTFVRTLGKALEIAKEFEDDAVQRRAAGKKLLAQEIDVDFVRGRVQEIKALSGDYEAAHSKEDDLFEAVLRTIAEPGGAGIDGDRAEELAREALKSKLVDFDRVCA